MRRINRFSKELALIVLLTGIIVNSFAQGLSEKNMDDLVQKTMSAFDVPGIALAVIKDGKTIQLKGYGIRSITNKKPVDIKTSFAIASNSKAFTAFSLGMLVDEGKLSWDSKVIDIIPEFKMYDPYVSSEFTVRDLLTHRSGLGLGA